MRRRQSIIGAAVLMVLMAAVAGWWYWFSYPPLDTMVARAVSGKPDGIYYTATAEVVTSYRGKPLKSQVTILQGRDSEEVVYPSRRGQGMYSRTNGNINNTYMPGTNTLLVSEKNSLLTQDERSKLLLKNYRPRFAGRDSIAGRPVYKVRLVSRYDDRPSRMLWIDSEYYVVLRTVEYSYRGQERGGTSFTHVEYTPAPDSTLIRKEADPEKVVEVCRPADIADIAEKVGVSVSKPSYVPPGYVLEGTHVYCSPCGRCKCAAQITYTDGLSVISVFQRSSKSSAGTVSCGMDKAKRETCEMSCCDVAGSGSINRSDKSIVVVADLPEEEIQKIARSVE